MRPVYKDRRTTLSPGKGATFIRRFEWAALVLSLRRAINKMNLKPRLSRDGDIKLIERGWRLTIPSGPSNRYRLSQLDDHLRIVREAYPWRPPVILTLRARISSSSIPGTWGFGFWNDPYGFSFGPGDSFLRLPTLPNAAWFFYASAQNYLSFRDDLPAYGLLAQAFQSPRFHPLLLRAGLALPFSRKETRRLLSQVIDENAVRIGSDATQWHTYRLEWLQERTSFSVDGTLALETPISPRPPLGLVLWLDNQYAAFTPQGKLRWGLEANPDRAWLEVQDLKVSKA